MELEEEEKEVHRDQVEEDYHEKQEDGEEEI